PRERLAFMLEDSGARVVLSQTALISALPRTSCPVIPLDSVLLEPPDLPPATELGVTPQNAAYIIYTSGSTGRPKGVIVTHENVVRLFAQTQQWFGFTREDVWTLFHSYAFDLSVWEIWGALIHGGRLVIVPYLLSRSPKDFYRLLAHENVTVLNQTPSAFRQLLWAEQEPDTPLELKLRYVIFGGEALELRSLQPWFARHGDQQPKLVNMYGITETTVHVTYRELRECDLEDAPGSVIGVPIPDLSVYLLDENLEPVPPGVPGEICVGGPGLARGYLNRPELTTERFIRDPFHPGNAARLYRSGDLARYTSRGELEYLGRMDDQVKIRGFRIELGEIESALSRHPHVRECAVVAHRDDANGPRLVAYLVCSPDAVSPAELRPFLQSTLPEYMIPSDFVPLEKLPLTANGKLDRRALPLPIRNTLVQPSGQAMNPVERLTADIWCELLGRTSVGLEDNFFELGGHSLLATQVISRLAAALGTELSVVLLFEAPTVAALARAAAQAQREQPGRMSAIPRRTAPVTSDDLLARLDGLSNCEVDEMLRLTERPNFST
ncbi:MAG TPA: amino acid adenylation domain-containing protein, partial [Verrucomicrobiae bacterium]|nr:amino acid adenylation domain-containing protein [Verrucomicrobiae bacterium]